ncbi:MAG: hypothetical protein K6U78_18050 [Anaerolineae bacterium]|jgi:hypothetical protein|nr:hypothetical protein [Anaerolineae bacterium]
MRAIGEIVRNATAFKFRSDQSMMDERDIIAAVSRLFALLKAREIDYVLVGGIALLQYVEGRNTEDIDLIIAASALQHLPEIVVEERNDDFARGKLGALRIDFLLTRNRLFDLVRRRYATTQQFVEQAVPCATVEGLLLLKLYALPSLYRQGDFTRVNLYEGDIAALMQSYQPEMQPLLDELGRHLSAPDVQEVRSIVAEIQGRIERFKRSSGVG